MATETLWGARRVHGELLKLGFDISERSVSRYLRTLRRRPDVHVLQGMLSDVEDHLERVYGVKKVTIVDAGPDQCDPKKALGVSAAPFLRLALDGTKVIGVTAWSETLNAAVEVMQSVALVPGPQPRHGCEVAERGRFVVNVFGGFCPHRTHTRSSCSGWPTSAVHVRCFLMGPGIVASSKLRKALKREQQCVYDRLPIFVVSVGALGNGTNTGTRSTSASSTKRSCVPRGPSEMWPSTSSTRGAGRSTHRSTRGCLVSPPNSSSEPRACLLSPAARRRSMRSAQRFAVAGPRNTDLAAAQQLLKVQ